jgi:hypothetical protein
MSKDPLLPPVLHPTALYKEEARRDATRIRAYNSILKQIYNRIKTVADVAGSAKEVMYQIPPFIPGTPKFDMGDAVLYIVWNLRNAGYTVAFTMPNWLFISWKAHDERYHAHESPWSMVLNAARSAVLSTPPPTTVSYARPAPAAPIPAAVVAAGAGSVEIEKRRSILKKTVEFKPPVEVRATNPSVLSALYESRPAAPVTTPKLPGQLSEKHVSFV